MSSVFRVADKIKREFFSVLYLNISVCFVVVVLHLGVKVADMQ